MMKQDEEELREESFKEKFPEKWLCPYCAQLQMCTGEIPRDEILGHVLREHGHEFEGLLNWENFYNRMIMVGGI